MFVAVLAAAQLFLGAPAARAQDEDTQMVRDNTVVLQVEGATADSVDVLLDDALVNDFVKFEPNRIVLDVPFTEETTPFTIVVVNREDGSELLRQSYQVPVSGVLDTFDAQASFQNDTVWRAKSRAKPPPPGYRTTDIANDWRLAATALATKGQWRAGIDGEITGTDDDNKSLRPGGPKIDVARGIGFVEYAGPVLQTRGTLGDVDMAPGVGLVNQGFQSRGFTIDARLLNERIQLSGGNVFGRDIRGTERGVEAFDTDNRRTAANLIIRAIQSEMANLEVSGSFLDVVRPTGQDFGFGNTTDGEENTVGGGGFKFDTWNGRLRFSGEYAYSTYANPENLNFDNEFGGSADIGRTEDKAYNMRGEVDVLQGETYGASLYAFKEQVDPLFLSVQSGATPDRKTYEYGTTLNWDFVTFTASKNVFDNNVDDIPSILTTRQRTRSAALEFALDQFREPPPPPEQPDQSEQQDGAAQPPPPEPGFNYGIFLPATISLSVSEAAVEALNAEVVGANSSINGSEIPHQFTVTYTVAFGWIWSFGDTSIDFSRSKLDTRQAGRDTADTRETSVGFSQSYRRDNWSTSIRLGLGKFENEEVTSASVDHRLEAGWTFDITFETLPNFSASFDVNRNKSVFNTAGNSALTNSWRVNSSLDFSKYIPKYVEDYEPYLRLNFSMDETDNRDPFIGGQRTFNYALSVAAGFKF